jgi:hypothetical protein
LFQPTLIGLRDRIADAAIRPDHPLGPNLDVVLDIEM